MRPLLRAIAVFTALLACDASTQDRASLFGEPTRDLPQLVGASSAHKSFLRAARAERQGAFAEAVAVYESFLGESVSEDRVVMVQVPARAAASQLIHTRTWRPARELAMARILSLPGEVRREYLERTGARARILWRFYEETGDVATLNVLIEGYLLHPEGARALLTQIDRALEGGELQLAASSCQRWLREVGDSGAGSRQSVQARAALAASLLGDEDLASRARLAAGRPDWLEPAEEGEPGASALTGGCAADLPAAPLPAELAAGLAAVRGGEAGLELALGEPLFAQRVDPRVFDYGLRPPSPTFRATHPLHQALPLLEPVRVDNALVLQTPMTLLVFDLSWGGSSELHWDPEEDQSFRLGARSGDQRFVRVGSSASNGLYHALRNSSDSYLDHFPLPRMHEQWTRVAPVVTVEPEPFGSAERLVAYLVQGEDGVARGYRYAGALAKVVLGQRAEPGVDFEIRPQPEILWVADTGTYMPSGRPLLRPGEGRLAIGMARDPAGLESTLEVVVADLDAGTGEVLSRTPVSTPPTNRAWKQDREIIALPHPVSVGATRNGSVVVCDNRGTIACVDMDRLRPAPAASEAAVEEPDFVEVTTSDGQTFRIPRPGRRMERTNTPRPAGTIQWAITYRSLHAEADSFDSGLRGWAASAIASTDSGVLVFAPSDSDTAFLVGPDAERIETAGRVDLELPLTTVPREGDHFVVAVHGDTTIVQGEVAAAFEPGSGTGWRSAPHKDDGVLLRRGALAEGGWYFEPRAGSIHVLDADTGKLGGILYLTGIEELDDDSRWILEARRVSVSILDDLLVLVTDQGLAAWRLY